KDSQSVVWQQNSQYGKFVHLVPLLEILAECYGVRIQTKKVSGVYHTMIENLGSELDILLFTDIKEIQKVSGERVAQAIQKVRLRKLTINPGYDGEYGKVAIWRKEQDAQIEQLKMI